MSKRGSANPALDGLKGTTYLFYFQGTLLYFPRSPSPFPLPPPKDGKEIALHVRGSLSPVTVLSPSLFLEIIPISCPLLWEMFRNDVVLFVRN
jgi:hypothetical protein